MFVSGNLPQPGTHNILQEKEENFLTPLYMEYLTLLSSLRMYFSVDWCSRKFESRGTSLRYQTGLCVSCSEDTFSSSIEPNSHDLWFSLAWHTPFRKISIYFPELSPDRGVLFRIIASNSESSEWNIEPRKKLADPEFCNFYIILKYNNTI